MDSGQLTSRLHSLGVDFSIATLRRLSNKGIIPRYETYYKRRPRRERGRPPKPGSDKAKERDERKQKGEIEIKRPGHYSEWSEKTFEEAAAFWAVQTCGVVKPRTLTATKVAEIKEAAHRLFESPKIFIESWSELTYTISPRDILATQVLEMTVKRNELNDLAVTWIAAEVKARNNTPMSKRVKVIIDWHYYLPYDVEAPHRSTVLSGFRNVFRPIRQLNEVKRRADQIMNDLIDSLPAKEAERRRNERDEMRFERCEPYFELLPPNGDGGDEVVICLPLQEFLEA